MKNKNKKGLVAYIAHENGMAGCRIFKNGILIFEKVSRDQDGDEFSAAEKLLEKMAAWAENNGRKFTLKLDQFILGDHFEVNEISAYESDAISSKLNVRGKRIDQKYIGLVNKLLDLTCKKIHIRTRKHLPTQSNGNIELSWGDRQRPAYDISENINVFLYTKILR